ncbi:MAG: hypothetical protein GKS07_01215 [Nitrosopumilus sp.]|nr:MAG: hypothetical protein GKS07_01215 [Nitrosopumilus sp.]
MKSILSISLFSLILIFGTSQSYADSGRILQDKMWDVPIQSHAIYTESGIETSFLDVGQQAYIAFPLRENQDDGPTIQTIKAGYPIADDKYFPRYHEETAWFNADSIDLSKPLSASFVPQEP